MVSIRILEYSKDKEEIEKIKQRAILNQKEIEYSVKKIIEKVRYEGDKAISYYTEKFDGVNISEDEFTVTKKEIAEAYTCISKTQINAIKKAIENVKKFSLRQKPAEFFEEIIPGVSCGILLRPIEKVGCYIPAGRYPLPSTAYMTIIPAKVAGVKEIIVATPPKKPGKADPGVIVASDIAGATRIIKIGGAQAIAALAYGTKTIPKVNKIVGPGNIYVTTAKKIVFGDVGLDMLAGPSEVVIIASEKADPNFVAADMLAQAEHDAFAAALLITDSKEFAMKVKAELNRQVNLLSTKDIIEKSFENCSCIVLVDSIEEAIFFANDFAPEHLEIIGYDKSILNGITNAGSIFFGEYSPEPAGDYCSGTNHVLPTMQSAKSRGGLSIYDFLKMITVQELTKEGLSSLKETISVLADMEGLPAHKNSVLKRFEDVEK